MPASIIYLIHLESKVWVKFERKSIDTLKHFEVIQHGCFPIIPVTSANDTISLLQLGQLYLTERNHNSQFLIAYQLYSNGLIVNIIARTLNFITH